MIRKIIISTACSLWTLYIAALNMGGNFTNEFLGKNSFIPHALGFNFDGWKMYTNVDKSKSFEIRVVHTISNDQESLESLISLRQGFLKRDIWMHIAIRFAGGRFPLEIRHNIMQYFCKEHHLKPQDQIELQLRYRNTLLTCSDDPKQFQPWKKVFSDTCL